MTDPQITSEGGLKERKGNINEQDETNNIHRGTQELPKSLERKSLELLPEPKRAATIQEALKRYTNLQGTEMDYLVDWDQFITDLQAQAVDTEEVELRT